MLLGAGSCLPGHYEGDPKSGRRKECRCKLVENFYRCLSQTDDRLGVKTSKAPEDSAAVSFMQFKLRGCWEDDMEVEESTVGRGCRAAKIIALLRVGGRG